MMMKETAFKNKTKNEVFSKLEIHGIKRNSGRWEDYEASKEIIFRGKFHPQYDTIIPWITKYVGV